jgi:hypothetical protein
VLPGYYEGLFFHGLEQYDLHRLFVTGMPGDDIKQLLGGVRLITAEFIHQGPTGLAGPECRDDIGVACLWELMAFLGEASNEISEGFASLSPQLFRF